MAVEVIEVFDVPTDVVEVLVAGPQGPEGPLQGVSYTLVTSSQTLAKDAKIAANTSGGAFTLTLPANPEEGDAVEFYDYAGTWNSNNLTIARNGKRIESLEENLICNINEAYFTLVYSGTARGWQVLPNFGGGGGGESALTTLGDTLYRGASENQRLPIGAAGQILKVSAGGIPEWGAAPATGVTSVTGTAPIASSGGNTPAISISEATTSAAGSMSAADKTKLDGIASGAEVNVNADWNASSGDAQILNKPTLGGAAALNVGTTTGTVAAGDDARLSDSRTPTAHAASHAAGGADELFDQSLNQADDVTFASVSLNAEGIKFEGNAKINLEERSLYGTWGSTEGFYVGSGSYGGSLTVGKNATTVAVFSAANLTDGSTRNIDIPDASGTLALVGDAPAAHALTSASHTAGNHKVFYSDGSGNVQELALGNSGEVLTSNGASSAPSFAAASGGISAIGASASDILSVSGSDLVADDPNADSIVYWNNTSNKLAYGTVSDVGAAAASHTHAASDVTSGTFDNARINFAAPPAIGSTTRNSGAFTALNANNGTITVDSPALVVAQDSASATAFNLAEFRMTGAGTSNSNLIRALSNGSQVFGVRRNGIIDATQLSWSSAWLLAGGNVSLPSGAYFGFTSSASGFSGQDTFIRRDAASTIAFRDLANPQTFRIYNTTDAGLTNFERGFMRWSSNVLQIGTEAGGTGSAKALEFQTGGVTRLTIATTGETTFTQAASFSHNVTVANGRVIGCNQINLNGTSTALLALGTDSTIRWGASSATAPLLKRSSTTLQVRLADDSAFAPFACAGLTLNGDLTASTRNIVTDATTGTRIGTATTQLLGFWNAAPSAQPAAVADATDAASTQARLNDLLARLRTIGIIAT